MRFLPKSRASMDRKPGPRPASAAPKVAKRMEFSRWLVLVKANQISTTITSTPAMGVHSPASRSVPAATATDCMMIVCSREVSSSAATPSRISQIPATSRRRRRALPGQPSGNVANNRCRIILNREDKHSARRFESPKTGARIFLFGGVYSSMIPRFRARVTAWVRSLAPSLERMLLTCVLTVSSVMES